MATVDEMRERNGERERWQWAMSLWHTLSPSLSLWQPIDILLRVAAAHCAETPRMLTSRILLFTFNFYYYPLPVIYYLALLLYVEHIVYYLHWVHLSYCLLSYILFPLCSSIFRGQTLGFQITAPLRVRPAAVTDWTTSQRQNA